MYANLKVRIRTRGEALGEMVYAWAVDVDGPTATIKLDGNDGAGNHAEPAGERTIDLTTHTISIGADF